MTGIDPVFAQWLQGEGHWHVSVEATLLARWGVTAQTTSRMTTIATKADAEAEGARQLAFLGGPLFVDRATVPGAWESYLGQVITVTIDKLGYDGGEDAFLIGAQDDLSAGTSQISVIRRAT